MQCNMDLSVQLAPKHQQGLLLANPVMVASGTFGYGIEHSHLFDIQQLGAIVCKGTTLNPREGNPQPRIAETPAGVLNSIGFQNIGVRALLKEKAPIWAKWRVPVIVNISGDTIDDYAQLAKELDNVPGISAIEVNISCPNLQCGGIEFGTDPEQAASVTSAVKSATSLPVLVKLTPNTSDIAKIAIAASESGADALTVINTLRGMAIDIDHRKPLLGNKIGGLSGSAIKPVALYMVYTVAEVVDIPVIGCGGITTASDAIEFIMAGASAVQVGVANMTFSQTPLEVISGISHFMINKGINKMGEFIGVARQ